MSSAGQLAARLVPFPIMFLHALSKSSSEALGEPRNWLGILERKHPQPRFYTTAYSNSTRQPINEPGNETTNQPSNQAKAYHI